MENRRTGRKSEKRTVKTEKQSICRKNRMKYRRLCAGVLLFLCVVVTGFLETVEASVQPENPVLVGGNRWLADEDSFVFVLLGDGFTAEEKTLFYEKAKETAAYILTVAPYSEHADLFKFYALFQRSQESGACGDTAESEAQALTDMRDTVYHSRYWTDGVKRLLALPEDEEQKALLIAKQYIPAMDVPVLLVNDSVYGGSGGELCVASLHEDSLEIVLHELGHTIAGLGDEYWPGADKIAEAPNVTCESDPVKVPWADLVGTDGIGVYAFADGEPGWYKPSETCKMQYLGKDHDFCAVCKKALTDSFYEKSHPKALQKMYVRITGLCVAAAVIVILSGAGIFKKCRKKRK